MRYIAVIKLPWTVQYTSQQYQSSMVQFRETSKWSRGMRNLKASVIDHLSDAVWLFADLPSHDYLILAQLERK